MDDMRTGPNDMDTLRRLLDSHGGDRTRWPARLRLQLAPLIAEDAEARRLVAEALALDRLLDTLPPQGLPGDVNLADRLVARAIAEGRPQAEPAGTDRVEGATLARECPADEGPATVPAMDDIAPRRVGRARSGIADWRAAALLAASLVLGVLAGGSGLVPPRLMQLAEATGLIMSSDSDPLQLALGAGVGVLSDEDSI